MSVTRGMLRRALVASLAAAALAPTLGAQRTPTPAIVALGAGADYTCALTRDGAVYCWGRNDVGQLGLGTSDALSHPLPTRVKLDVAAVSLGVGYDHVCVTTADGAAWCWGDDRMMESGSPSRVERCADGARRVSCRTTPAMVEGSTHFRFVAAGFRASCGIGDERRVYCWGDRAGSSPSPVFAERHVGGAPGVVAFDTLAMGAFAICGVAKGDLHCWSGNGVNYPVVPRVDHVSVGLEHACGMRSTRVTRCWGERALGALGIGEASTLLERGAFIDLFPAGPPLVGERTMIAVSAGGLHSCGIDAVTRQAMCWGANQWGQLGNGKVDVLDGAAIRGANPEPLFIASRERFALIAAGVEHSCGVTEKGAVLCWGRARRGATGMMGQTSQSTPALVPLATVRRTRTSI